MLTYGTPGAAGPGVNAILRPGLRGSLDSGSNHDLVSGASDTQDLVGAERGRFAQRYGAIKALDEAPQAGVGRLTPNSAPGQVQTRGPQRTSRGGERTGDLAGA